jgi:predicted alpha/beta hydrolase family esterase
LKKAVILHGTDGSPEENWFAWLREELKTRGYEVWLPQLPDAHEPNAKKWTHFLLRNGWDFTDNLLIGHSAGAVEVLHFLQNLSGDTHIKNAVLVGVFSQVLAEEPDWKQLKGLFEEPFDFAKIKPKAEKFLIVHGDNDPWCDPKQAQYIAQQVAEEYIEIPGGQHFSTALDPSYTKFPKLIEILEAHQLL